MRYRLYFVLPDVASARQVEDDLLLAKIEDRRMHFLAKRGTDLKGLPEASIFQKTDLLHGMEVGMVVGAAAGAALGLGLFFYPVLGTALGIAKIFIGALGGALFGIWAAGMIGISTPNKVLKQFERTMQEGHVLMMVDVPQHQVEKIRQLVLARHPEAEAHGVEPTVPAFP
ncbi:MAG: DUF1269 domain-containing protein [Chromatiales bacterium]